MSNRRNKIICPPYTLATSFVFIKLFLTVKLFSNKQIILLYIQGDSFKAWQFFNFVNETVSGKE